MGRVIETRDVACEDDAAAAEYGSRLLRELPHAHAIELWVRPRLVGRLTHNPEAPQTLPAAQASGPRQR